MTVMDPDQLVNEYIEDLDRAARSLPTERRAELLADVRLHVAESGATTEAEVRNILERLGSPEEILSGYEEAHGTPTRPEPRLRLREYAALALLPFGGFVFGVGWLVGVVLLWASDRWRRGEKMLGTLVLPFGYLSLMITGTLGTRTCTGASSSSGEVVDTCTGFAVPIWIGTPLVIVLAIAPVAVVALLAYRAAPDRG